MARDVVETQACNQCHNPLSSHGGDRRDVALCVPFRHSPQTADDDGASLDMKVMVHEIHRGSSLASLPYQLVGDGQQVFDYSTVAFPQGLQNCTACHIGKGQPDVWKTDAPTRLVCGSCHDGTYFGQPPAPAGQTAHPGGPMADDTQCSVCHPTSGGLAGVATVHLTDLTNPASPKLALAITNSVDGGKPTPTVTFTVQVNGQGVDTSAPSPSLAVTVAGPTAPTTRRTGKRPSRGSGVEGQPHRREHGRHLHLHHGHRPCRRARRAPTPSASRATSSGRRDPSSAP